MGCEPCKNPVRILKNFEFDRFTPLEWIALAIGNSRLHWAWFQKGELIAAWDTAHPALELAPLAFFHQNSNLPADAAFADLPIYIASVVPAQTAFWQTCPQAQLLTLEQIPLRGLYPTLGIDRALALWGAVDRNKLPALVIDAGTALTFTGANAQQEFIGGAILPGLTLQRRSLSDQTAALPLIQPSKKLPPRWAKTTAEAIGSGIFYTVLSGIKDFISNWEQEFGQGAIVLTGGDAPSLVHGLKAQHPELAQKITIDPHLLFRGMQAIVEQG
ncbi:pantothenate kinase [Cyanobacteria bacterium FACHB-502]|nr:pantothenate kinase [Cyanobacteria bacterium FACHB-502]MBD2023638.1 pantothenate kinase [Leptolyngbya sp. FACHB-711]